MNDHKLLTPQRILLNAIKMPPQNRSGIYFLIFKSEIIYIGRAINVYIRICGHGDKRFDSWAWVPCPTAKQKKVERAYLDKFLPPLNCDPITQAARVAAGQPRARIERRNTPPGCYWRKHTLWGRLILGGREYRTTLRTSDSKEAIRRRRIWANSLHDQYFASQEAHVGWHTPPWRLPKGQEAPS
jgi:hypothetical protein